MQTAYEKFKIILGENKYFDRNNKKNILNQFHEYSQHMKIFFVLTIVSNIIIYIYHTQIYIVQTFRTQKRSFLLKLLLRTCSCLILFIWPVTSFCRAVSSYLRYSRIWSRTFLKPLTWKISIHDKRSHVSLFIIPKVFIKIELTFTNLQQHFWQCEVQKLTLRFGNVSVLLL